MIRGVRALVIALLVSPAVACSGDGDGAGPDGGAGDGDDGGPDSGVPSTVDPSNRFASGSEEWSVPENGHSEGFAQPASYTSYRYWTTLDIDGDRKLDIVHTGATDLTQSAWDAAGSPYWKLFRGGDGRWSADAFEWRIPASGESSGFYTHGDGSGGWKTFDITGDGKPDLVQTSDPTSGYVWDADGNPYWKVFANDGEGGFERPAIDWPVPDGSGSAYGFSSTDYESTYSRWATLDIDGDRKPDLVQTADTSTGYVWDADGEPYWKVFKNTGDGFERQATVWSVPESGTSGGFFSVLTSSPGQWRVMDLDDDGRTDLVQTSDPATGYVWDAAGEPYWKVFAGDGEGFALSPDKWSVPPSSLDDGFFTAAAATSYRYWSVVDIDGDRDLDLVQTGDVSHTARAWDASGDPYWKVYRNEGGGFSSELHRWPIPKSGTDEGFYLVAGAASYTTWALLDADADGHPDLVQTEDPATGTVWDATGAPYWKIFRGEE